jgi:hypothetical protein
LCEVKHTPSACISLPLAASLLPASAYLQPAEIYVDDESKLTLHGLVQHYVMLHEEEKNRKLTDLLDALDFNQVGCGCRPLLVVWAGCLLLLGVPGVGCVAVVRAK